MIHVALRPLAAVACLLSVAIATPAAAVTPSMKGWRWARSANLNLAIGDNLSAAWKPYLAPATAAWSIDPIIDMTPVAGKATTPACAPVYGTVQVCNGAYGFNGWLGYTNVWLSSGYIVMANVRLNDSYFASAKYNTTAWREMTICHELGHSLGLDHANSVKTNANLGTCMDYTNDPTGLTSNGPLANVTPYGGDFAGLAALYALPGGVQLVQTRFTIVGEGLGVPEPASWMMLIAGFGLVGATLRWRRSAAA